MDRGGWIKRHYHWSLTSLVLLARGEGIRTLETSGREGTRIPKKVIQGEGWILCSIIHFETTEKGETAMDWCKIFKFLPTSGLRSSSLGYLLFYQKQPFFHPLLSHHRSWLFLAVRLKTLPFSTTPSTCYLNLDLHIICVRFRTTE